MQPLTRGIAIGICLAYFAVIAFKLANDRLNRIERAAARTSSVVGSPDPDWETKMVQMRKEHARMFAEDLREQGLVITEAV